MIYLNIRFVGKATMMKCVGGMNHGGFFNNERKQLCNEE